MTTFTPDPTGSGEPVRDVQAAAHTVAARHEFRCENYPPCSHLIQPGEDYARHVAFPGHEANGGTVPWVLRLCRGCHTQYGREMPPRRTRRTKERSS